MASPEIRVLIVDDEQPARTNLRLALAEHPHWRIIGECASSAQARAVLAGQAVDVVFLDVQMPRESGVELARSLCALDEPPLIVFVTGYDHYAVAAFEVHALDYLLKPFDDRRLAQCTARVEAMLAARQRSAYAGALREYVAGSDAHQAGAAPRYWQRITIRSVGKLESVDVADVLWITASSNYVELHLGQRVLLHRAPMAQLEAHLDPAHFVRVHRGTIVAVKQLVGLRTVGDGRYELTLGCGEQVGVSETYVKQLRALMHPA